MSVGGANLEQEFVVDFVQNNAKLKDFVFSGDNPRIPNHGVVSKFCFRDNKKSG